MVERHAGVAGAFTVRYVLGPRRSDHPQVLNHV